MPTPFPDGQTTLPDVLDGSVDEQIACDLGITSPTATRRILPVGLVTGQDRADRLRRGGHLSQLHRRGRPAGDRRRLSGEAQPGVRRQRDAPGHALARRRSSTPPSTGPAAGPASRSRSATTSSTCPTGAPLAQLDGSQAPWPDAPAKEPGYQFRGYRLGEKRQSDVPLFRRRRADRGLSRAGRRAGLFRRCSGR